MKRRFTLILIALTASMLLIFLLANMTNASALTEGNFEYMVESGEATVTGLTDKSYSGELVIPDTFGGYSVTSIGWYAFYGCTGLTSITIGNSVTSIGSSAFYNCSGLTSITIPDSMTSIGSRAFFGCTGLTSITIPDFVTDIGSEAFYNCTGLTSITIPNSVTNIENGAFAGCTGLTSITIPDSVTSIGNGAFSNTVWYNNQPDGLIYVGKVAYKYKGICPSTIKIENGTIGISSGSFYGCRELTSVTIPDSVTYIGINAFSGCTGLTDIEVPESLIEIGSRAFDNTAWYNNQSDGLVYLGKMVYGYKGSCPSALAIDDGTISICPEAFRSCSELKSVILPTSIKYIGNYAFAFCTGLTGVSIPNSVEIIDERAFLGCTSLSDISLPSSLVHIGYSAFEECTSLTNVTIPDSITIISSMMFYDCTSLKSVQLGDSVSIIGEAAFNGCCELTSITFGKSLKKIEAGAFMWCSKIAELSIPSTVVTMDNNAFAGCRELKKIYIPDSVTYIGKDSFVWRDNFGNHLTVTVYGVSGSYAEQYAKDNDIPFVATMSKTRSGNATVYYTVAENAITVVSVKCDSGALAVIPSEIDGVAVTKLGEGAIGKNSGVGTVEIPDSVTEIAENTITVENIAVRCSRGSAAYTFAESKAIRQLVLGETAYGDATGDGKVTAVDLVRMKKYLASQTSDGDAAFGLIQEADTNEDGIVDSLDIVRLKRYFAEYDYATGTSTVTLGKTA